MIVLIIFLLWVSVLKMSKKPCLSAQMIPWSQIMSSDLGLGSLNMVCLNFLISFLKLLLNLSRNSVFNLWQSEWTNCRFASWFSNRESDLIPPLRIIGMRWSLCSPLFHLGPDLSRRLMVVMCSSSLWPNAV